MAKKKKGKPKANPAFLEAMVEAAKAEEARLTAEATAAWERKAKPYVNPNVFEKPAVKTPIEYAVGFLLNPEDKKAKLEIKKGLQGIKLAPIQQALAAGKEVPPLKAQQVIKVAEDMGCKFPDATNG